MWPWSPYSRPSHTFSCPEKVDPLYTLAYNLHPYNADFLQAIHSKAWIPFIYEWQNVVKWSFHSRTIFVPEKKPCLQFKSVTIWPCRDVELTLSWQKFQGYCISNVGKFDSIAFLLSSENTNYLSLFLLLYSHKSELIEDYKEDCTMRPWHVPQDVPLDGLIRPNINGPSLLQMVW